MTSMSQLLFIRWLLENDYLLVETNTKFVGIGKAIEDKIKPVRVFNL